MPTASACRSSVFASGGRGEAESHTRSAKNAPMPIGTTSAIASQVGG
jgi:hypothetical protein